MGIVLSEVVKHTRLRHPAFTREAIPTVALAQALSDYQRELIKLTGDRLATLVVDRFSVAFDFAATDPGALLMTATKFGVVTSVPAFRDDDGDGILLGDADVPDVDTDVDLSVRYEDGLELPPHYKILGGTCALSTDGTTDSSDPTEAAIYPGARPGSEFHIVAYDQRNSPPVFPSGYVLGNKLYLCGSTTDWQGFTGIDVRYVPLPIDLVSTTDVFLLPEICRDALNARADLAAAEWSSTRGAAVDASVFWTVKNEAEQKLLQAVSDRQSAIVRTLKRNR